MVGWHRDCVALIFSGEKSPLHTVSPFKDSNAHSFLLEDYFLLIPRMFQIPFVLLLVGFPLSISFASLSSPKGHQVGVLRGLVTGSLLSTLSH